MWAWMRTITASPDWRTGLRMGVGLALAVFPLALSFGTAAVASGWPAWLVVMMSALVFAAGAQFALVVAFGEGGFIAALVAAALVNLRFVPMGAAIARSLVGGRWARSLQAQAVIDGSWAVARRADGTFSRESMIAASLVQWPVWVAVSAVGAYLTPDVEIARAWGLDAVFPAFFTVFVLDAFRDESRHRLPVVGGAVTAAVACWFVPSGLALLCAAVAAPLVMCRRRRSE